MIRCLIRNESVAATPEEFVRQRVLSLMLQLGYPKGLIAVEQSLHRLPHLQSTKVPLRRADILCFGNNHSPLMLVECKAAKLTEAVFRQVAGYNHYVRANFIAIANSEEIRLGWIEGKVYRFISHLPKYEDLFIKIKDNSAL